MASQMESGAAGGASDSATSQSEAAMHDVSVVKGEPARHGGAVAHGSASGPVGPFPSYHGRTVSWTAVSIMMVGFVVGGLAMVFGHDGPIWWLFWVGAGVAVLGLLISLATNTFEDWY